MKRSTSDVPEEHRNQNDEQVAARHADASGVYIMENQHKEKIMRDIQVSKRGSGATSEEQSDKWRKIERAEHAAPNTSASSGPCVALEYPVSGGIQSRRGPYLCRNQVMFMTTCKFPRWMNSTRWMDERAVISEKCWRYRGEDAGDLERIELVEKWTCLNAFEKKLCKLNPKVVTDEKINPKILTEEKNWRTWKSNQNTVMGEQLVQNVAMGETSWRTL